MPRNIEIEVYIKHRPHSKGLYLVNEDNPNQLLLFETVVETAENLSTPSNAIFFQENGQIIATITTYGEFVHYAELIIGLNPMEYFTHAPPPLAYILNLQFITNLPNPEGMPEEAIPAAPQEEPTTTALEEGFSSAEDNVIGVVGGLENAFPQAFGHSCYI
jgi:hypothetical protein